PCDELINQVGRKHMPVPDGQVLAETVHLAQWRKSGKNLRARVQEVAFARIVMILQVADEDAVVVAESMVHANHVIRPGKFGWRVPVESGSIEPVTNAGDKIVWQRFALDQSHDCRIAADA